MKKTKRITGAALGLVLALQICAAAPASAAGAIMTKGYENADSAVNLTQIGRYTSGQFHVDGGVMEIVAYDQANGFAYAINGQSGLLASIPLGGLAGIKVRVLGQDALKAEIAGISIGIVICQVV